MKKHKKRLGKALASAGVGARRKCDDLIFAKRVKVNGKVADSPGILVDLSEDVVTVNGKRVEDEAKVYYILNKPKGYHCTNKRPGERAKIVIDLFPENNERLFCVGRLDKETEGLLVVTNDGDFANKLIHPSSNISKEYLVKTDKEITPEHLKKLSEGIEIDGRPIRPVKVKKVRRGTIKISVKEGKKHEVRLMLADADLEVLSLQRIRVGHLVLGNLQPGEFRSIKHKEIRDLWEK